MSLLESLKGILGGLFGSSSSDDSANEASESMASTGEEAPSAEPVASAMNVEAASECPVMPAPASTETEHTDEAGDSEADDDAMVVVSHSDEPEVSEITLDEAEDDSDDSESHNREE